MAELTRKSMDAVIRKAEEPFGWAADPDDAIESVQQINRAIFLAGIIAAVKYLRYEAKRISKEDYSPFVKEHQCGRLEVSSNDLERMTVRLGLHVAAPRPANVEMLKCEIPKGEKGGKG